MLSYFVIDCVDICLWFSVLLIICCVVGHAVGGEAWPPQVTSMWWRSQVGEAVHVPFAHSCWALLGEERSCIDLCAMGRMLFCKRHIDVL